MVKPRGEMASSLMVVNLKIGKMNCPKSLKKAIEYAIGLHLIEQNGKDKTLVKRPLVSCRIEFCGDALYIWPIIEDTWVLHRHRITW